MCRLTLLQIDPIKAVAPSADLVLWSRPAAARAPRQLRRALEVQRLDDNKNVQRMLIFLVRSGQVAVAGGTGLRRSRRR